MIQVMLPCEAQPLWSHTTEHPHGYAAYHVVDYAICYCVGYGVEFGDTAKYSVISNKNQRAVSITPAALLFNVSFSAKIRCQFYTIALEEFHKSVIFWYQRLEIRIEVISLRR